MPIYQFQNEKTGEKIDVVMSVHDTHEYVDKTGYKWQRVWTVPNAAVDTVVDPFNSKDFVNKTTKKGSVGDLWDLSAELSHKRAEKTGTSDAVKENYYKNYSRKRKNLKHQTQVKEKVDKTVINI